MHNSKRGFLLMVVLAIAACAGTNNKPDQARPIDDLSDVPRSPPPGALPDPAHDNLNAVLWVQTSAEYRALALQAFHQAARTLAIAKADPTFSALPPQEQGELRAEMPVAIITDIDETVLDNSAFSADLIQRPIPTDQSPEAGRKAFGQRWSEWVAQREAIPVPGAVSFLNQAAASGVRIFYITNRTDPERAETCNNLIQVGLPLSDCESQVLTRNDADGRPKEKGSRRKMVAKDHRVVMLIGDNLGDFMDGVYTDVEARAKLVDTHEAWWGERWIVLPNPMYGSWEEVLANLENDASSPSYGVEQERRRLLKGRALRGVDWWANPQPMPSKSK